MQVILVGLGGACGAVARYVLGTWVAGRLGSALPHGTLFVNLSGSLLLGFVFSLGATRGGLSTEFRALVAVGFLGAYTTFSTFSWETIDLIQAGRLWAGLTNVGLHLAGGVLAVLAGVALARLV